MTKGQEFRQQFCTNSYSGERREMADWIDMQFATQKLQYIENLNRMSEEMANEYHEKLDKIKVERDTAKTEASILYFELEKMKTRIEQLTIRYSRGELCDNG
jgi:hypothetical protein